MSDDNLKGFQKKIADRKFSMDNAWQAGDLPDDAPACSETDGAAEKFRALMRTLDENLSAAAGSKNLNDGYFPIYSCRRIFGGCIVFLKRAFRKLIKIFAGWYVFPIFRQSDVFRGKTVNAITLERDILAVMEQQIEESRGAVSALQQQLSRAETELSRLRRETAELHEKNARLEEFCHRNDLHLSDEFYHDFEERFRGSPEVIRERLKVYLPYLQPHLPDWAGASFIDLGSGRGEWLDILRYYGAANYVGVDLNERQNRLCAERGHRVVCMDCMEYLDAQPEESADLITAFQVIEHLSAADLMRLLKSCRRVLKPGGMILFETQNPQNLIVGADTFYIDPTHIRHIDPQLTEYLVSCSGYSQVQIIPANACPNWAGVDAAALPEAFSELVRQFNEVNYRLYGPQDYAVLAVKES